MSEKSYRGTAMHVYENRPRKDKRGTDLISDALPFGRLWYGEPNAVSSAIVKFNKRSVDAVIRCTIRLAT
jgi:hypothetical protein